MKWRQHPSIAMYAIIFSCHPWLAIFSCGKKHVVVRRDTWYRMKHLSHRLCLQSHLWNSKNCCERLAYFSSKQRCFLPVLMQDRFPQNIRWVLTFVLYNISLYRWDWILLSFSFGNYCISNSCIVQFWVTSFTYHLQTVGLVSPALMLESSYFIRYKG